MTLYQTLKQRNFNLSAVGLEQRENEVTYFCTPKGAKILGWAGVDGIHFCTIRGLGKTVFAVSPMSTPGEYVHPIAKSFEDLLGLLLSCGSMDAVEQAYLWDRVRFDEYCRNNPPSEKFSEVMNTIREQWGITPVDDPFSYIKDLQDSFDYGTIPYPPEYYDPDMNPDAPDAPDVPEQWRVTYEGGFTGGRGRAGKEIAVKQTFLWGREKWYVPSVYICGRGLVIDFCMEADPDELKAYIDKWDLLHESRNHYTKDQMEQMRREHPLNPEFGAYVTLNGKELRRDHGCGITWIPEGCLNEEFRNDTQAKQVLEHYGLDPLKGWSFCRSFFLWSTKRAPVLRSLKVLLRRDPVTVTADQMVSPKAGDVKSFTHPVTGVRHSLTVRECEAQRIDQRHFQNDDLEYPCCYTMLTYTLEPEIPGNQFWLRDDGDGDSPRQKRAQTDGFAPKAVSGIGIIGGADGPTAIIMSGRNSSKLHTAYSSLYFEPRESICWRLSVRIRTMEDMEVVLL